MQSKARISTFTFWNKINDNLYLPDTSNSSRGLQSQNFASNFLGHSQSKQRRLDTRRIEKIYIYICIYIWEQPTPLKSSPQGPLASKNPITQRAISVRSILSTSQQNTRRIIPRSRIIPLPHKQPLSEGLISAVESSTVPARSPSCP